MQIITQLAHQADEDQSGDLNLSEFVSFLAALKETQQKHNLTSIPHANSTKQIQLTTIVEVESPRGRVELVELVEFN